MMENYDEDLAENPFFQVLQTDHFEVFRKATIEGWIICVPRAGSVPKYALTHEDFFGHILIPSDELPESHFRTLNEKEVRILNRVITIEQEDISRPYITHILFEETFYNDDLKYKILCIDNPLERLMNVGTGQIVSTNFLTINTLRDSIDLLWTECGGPGILEKIDNCVKNFCLCNDNFECEPLQNQKDLLGTLYIQCLQLTLRDSRLREKTTLDKHLLENVKLSVETYMHHGVYKSLIKGITACTAIEDSHLNKIIRNLSDIQLRDLGIRTDLYNAVPWAKQELSRIDCYSTVLGKIGCLKRMVSSISQQNGEKKEVSICNAISADDLLPMIVFLVIKTGLPNWVAHLTYVKEFHFSASVTKGVDEHSFLITSLEAAIEHVKSGVLIGPSDPESQMEQEEVFVNSMHKMYLETSGIRVSEQSGGKSFGIGHFFDQIRLGNEDYVKEIIDKKNLTNEISDSLSPQLCHPLCSCDKCESTLSKHLCDTTPTIHSCDDRGFTALHVASLFGQSTIVDLLINCGSNINATDYSSSTPLHYAAAKGHQNSVLLLVHSGCHMEVQDNDCNTPLHFAANNGHEGCVKALLYFAENIGCHLDVNCRNSFGDTPLHHASRWGYEGIVQILLDYGAFPDIQNKRHLTPLDLAHSLHISRLLIKQLKCGQSVQSLKSVAKDNLKSVIGCVAAASKKTLDLSEQDNASLFFTKGRNIHSAYRPQSSDQMKQVEKVLRAIAHGDTRLACFYLGLEEPILESGINLVGDNKAYCHPLCTCEKCRPSDSIEDSSKKLTPEKKVINVNACNTDGFTALHVASMHGHSEMVRLLLDCGAHTNVTTRSKGVTPLHLACQNQRFSVVDLLLQTNDCDINVQDIRGNTPLHYACYTNNLRLVKLILNNAPSLNIKNIKGKTPREEAEENMSITMVQMLKNTETLFQHTL